MTKQEVQLLIGACHKDGKKAAVSFCSHIPQEILEAAGIHLLRLPHISDAKDSASRILPKNVCPIVKKCCDICEDASLAAADLVLAETSCDGKKKMYELLSNQDRVYFYQVAQGVDRDYTKPLIKSECTYLVKELKKRFDIEITEDAIRDAGKLINQERESVVKLMEIQRQVPPPALGGEIFQALESHRSILDTEKRITANNQIREKLLTKESLVKKRAKRLLVTGCPLNGAYNKIINAVEDNGGVVVCFENCEVMKSAVRHFDPSNPDVFDALADCYQNTACAIMAPNALRFELLRQLATDYQVDGIVDVTLQTCHAYTCERDKMSRFCEDELEIPYMPVETDLSDADVGQLGTRIAAFVEML